MSISPKHDIIRLQVTVDKIMTSDVTYCAH
jgi:hypothetical protein